ncbi:DUF885 domain-containing protein [Polymorphobacter sp.]|uniref:DUF885 domain-containing protein n=1 Tax=Polymorphobacter sp. TaxID=1909290 RepID=UPI003F6EBF19
MIDRRGVIGLIGAGAALAGAGPVLAADDPAARLRALIDAATAADAALDPLGEVGVRKAVFVDPLSDGWASAFETAKRGQARALAALPRDALGPVDRIAYDVLAWKTGTQAAELDAGLLRVRREAPLNPSFGLHIETADFVSGAGAPFATLADYEAGLVRLDGFAGHLRQMVGRLDEGLAAGRVQPALIVDAVLGQIDAMLALPVEDSPFYAAIKRMPTALAGDRDRLAKAYRARIEGEVLPAYAAWGEMLRGRYRPRAGEAPGRWAMKDGAALYAAELAEHTTTDLDAEAIHALGVSEVARIRGEMEAVRGRIGFAGDLKAMFDHVRTNPAFYCKSDAELLERFAAIETRIWKRIPALFHRAPKAPFRVAPLPALGEQRGTGYYKPGPADGVSPGTLFFNMAMRPTRPIPTLETLTLHEGIPGHHFQITLARETATLPDLLRYGSNTAYAEGWGLYAESLGRELGMFEDPWQWFGHLDMEMLRAVRLVVDTGLHAQRWGRQQALDYMLDNTSMAPRDVAVEVDRYIAYPGQACAYKIGELTFRRLRGETAAALGPRFDVRDFHGQCLDTGALPMAVLEAKLRGWMKA